MDAPLAGAAWLDVNLNHALHLKNVTRAKSGAMHRMVQVAANKLFGLTGPVTSQAQNGQLAERRTNKLQNSVAVERFSPAPPGLAAFSGWYAFPTAV